MKSLECSTTHVLTRGFMKLSCHCNSIEIEIKETPERLLSCNCSICHRYGSLWGYYPQEEVTISTSAEIGEYCRESANLIFCHCTRCGCLTHYKSGPEAQERVYGLNFRMAPRSETEKLPVRRFDGADSWQFLD